MDNLRILSDFFVSEKDMPEKAFILSVDNNTTSFNSFSFEIEDNKPVLLSIFHDEAILDDGFKVLDLNCWKQFVEMIKNDTQAKLSLTM